ncbi:hypothetical protein [Haloarchaeobius amylolyticus]|uniref:hypothetical protein n=1 Tax=Haloarchaeobius amylolyticus TaxID=1198296 RepID=UPI00226EB342|nr:hypothetical protein [Haloarchaeobius amylolyticus]
MDRRRFLKRSGVALASTTLAATPVAAAGDGDAPNDQVETTLVSPVGDDFTVPAGSWVDHRLGWVDRHEPSKRAYIEEYLEKLNFISYTIDGEPVENPDDYWNEPYVNENDYWTIYWEYTTPPVDPGVHEVAWTIEYEEPIDDGDRVFSGGPYTLSSEFEVVPGKKGNGKGKN